MDKGDFMKKKIVIISVVCFLIDQIFKSLLDRIFYLGQTITIIPSFFSLTYVRNDGAAWSLLAGNQIFLIVISILAIFALYYFFIKGKELNILEAISYGLLYGGIFGNLIDRIFRGYVIDFFDFTLSNYHFPVFNIADICIVIGVLFVILSLWKGEKHGKTRSNNG